VVALATGTGGLVFVIVRLMAVAHGNVAVFIIAGSAHSSADLIPKGIPVVKGTGYDGQFYYRMALDPADLARSAFGVRFDTTSRLERIGYPAIAWLFAGGRSSIVPITLVATNVVALGALGLGGALMARDSGRHAAWGAVLAGYWGYLWSISRDLTEITAAAFLIFGLYAYRRHRWWLSGVCLLGAVLSKETAAYVVAIIAATRLYDWLAHRGRRPLGATDIAWGVPLLGFVAWQLLVYRGTGSLPLGGSGKANLGVPFLGPIDGFRHYIDALPSVVSTYWLAELALLTAIAVAAGLSIRLSDAPAHERVAWAAVVLLALIASPGIWLGDVGFRSLDDVYLFSWIVLLATPRRLGPLGGLIGCTWLVVAVELVLFL
jgi:hypothetical protein